MAENLPVEIASDLFSRVPADTVLECERVCKTWRDLLSHDKTNFAAMHLSRQYIHHRHDHHNNDVSSEVSTLGLIFLVKSPKPRTTRHPIRYGEFDENNTELSDEHCIKNTLRSINYPLVPRRQKMNSLVGSCNGLICLGEPTNNGLLDPIHICNPITREWSQLRGFNENNGYCNVTRIYSGFGYIPRTDEYKVVRILYDGGSRRGHVQVYTLGGGSGWRNIGETACSLYEQHGIFANGAIHWLSEHRYSHFQGTQEGTNIMAFNLSDEKIHDLPTGPFSERTYRFTCILGSFGGWLSVTGCKSYHPDNCLDLWSLKNISSEKGIAATDFKDGSWSWCKEFSISTPDNSFSRNYRPFAVTKSGLILFKYRDGDYPYAQALFCYDPETATLRRYTIQHFYEVIPHTNSFVSLKALGETCKKRKKR